MAFRGSISAVLASDVSEAVRIAESLGKKTESHIYYRRIGDLIRSVLVPEKFMDQAEAISLSTSFYLKVSRFDALAAELALMAEASGLTGLVMTEDRESFLKYFGELNLSKMVREFAELDRQPNDSGYVYVDRAFNVRGVGTVVLGFALTEVSVHDKLIAYPMMKEVEVKSIQVLDEDQERVLPGTRIGFALKNAKLEEIEGVKALLKPGVKLVNRFKYVKFKWASEAQGVHLFAGGIKVLARIDGDDVTLEQGVPETIRRGILINPNPKPRTPRVFGWAEN
ncbi:MAG: translation elongation factor [Thermoprotei archaeon]